MSNLAGRLYNWKFGQALTYLDEQEISPDLRALVEALAETFGDSGWFEGQLGIVVGVSVTWALTQLDEPDGQVADLVQPQTLRKGPWE